MPSNVTIVVCFLVITPICVVGSCFFWKWLILQQEVKRIDEEMRAQRAGTTPAAAPAETPETAPTAMPV